MKNLQLDEVQRVPELFTSLKAAPGNIYLSGAASARQLAGRGGSLQPFPQRGSGGSGCGAGIGGRVAGVEVKAASTVTSNDFRGLRKLRNAAPNNFAAGVVRCDGGAVGGFGDRLYAVPVSGKIFEAADRRVERNKMCLTGRLAKTCKNCY
jgi:hypothetical protein